LYAPLAEGAARRVGDERVLHERGLLREPRVGLGDPQDQSAARAAAGTPTHGRRARSVVEDRERAEARASNAVLRDEERVRQDRELGPLAPDTPQLLAAGVIHLEHG